MNEFVDMIADEINKKINIPLLTEQQEKALIVLILTIVFSKLPGWLKLPNPE